MGVVRRDVLSAKRLHLPGFTCPAASRPWLNAAWPAILAGLPGIDRPAAPAYSRRGNGSRGARLEKGIPLDAGADPPP